LSDWLEAKIEKHNLKKIKKKKKEKRPLTTNRHLGD
jgi:hypothetical protein